MRIIHEIEAPMQCIIGTKPYRGTPGTEGYTGTIVDITLVTAPRSAYPEDAKVYREDEEIIEIHGGIEYILEVFRQVVELLEETKRNGLELGKRRLIGCPNCRTPLGDNHTWECLAKWSDELNHAPHRALDENPDMIAVQKDNAERWVSRPHHENCAGLGCPECEYRGIVEEG